MKRAIKVIILFLGSLSAINAQETEQEKTPIESQFNSLLEKSNDYQGYKVIDYNELIQLKENTSEYISDLQNRITTKENLIKEQQEEISSLKAVLESTQNRLQILEAEKEIMRFLGIPMAKENYKLLVWSIIGVLVIILIIFFFSYKKAKRSADEIKMKMEQTEKEFEAYRAKALEKEQRLGRLLQDERNKAGGK